MMNWIDVGIIGIILFSAVLSLMRGFLKEALSLIGWVVAFFVSSKYYPYVEPYLESYIQDPKIKTVAAIGLLFIITILVCSIVSHIITLIVVRSFVSGIDRILGLAFGVARGILIVVAIIFFTGKFFPKFTEMEVWQTSVMIPHFDVFNRWFFDFLSTASDSIDMEHIDKQFNL